MDITPKKRSKIITLHEFGNKTKRQVAAECRVSLGAVNNIIRKKMRWGPFHLKAKDDTGESEKHPRKMMPLSSD